MNCNNKKYHTTIEHVSSFLRCFQTCPEVFPNLLMSHTSSQGWNVLAPEVYELTRVQDLTLSLAGIVSDRAIMTQVYVMNDYTIPCVTWMSSVHICHIVSCDY